MGSWQVLPSWPNWSAMGPIQSPPALFQRSQQDSSTVLASLSMETAVELGVVAGEGAALEDHGLVPGHGGAGAAAGGGLVVLEPAADDAGRAAHHQAAALAGGLVAHEAAATHGGVAFVEIHATAPGVMPAGDGETLDHGGEALALVELEDPVMLELRTLGVEDARGRVAALGAQGDGLAEQVEVAVARAGEGAIEQLDHVAVLSRHDGFLDGERAVGSDDDGGAGTHSPMIFTSTRLRRRPSNSP
jgi:hypothetical protein